MNMHGSTKYPDEVKAAFALYADVLDQYASDQLASKRWQSTKRDLALCDERSRLYSELATEMREIVWEQE